MKRAKKRKNYVLDTNVLMHDPWSFANFDGNNVYIPVTVLEELDHLKSRDGLAGYQAREAVRTLHRTIDGCGRQCVTEGISLSNDIRLHVVVAPPGAIHPFTEEKNDNHILSCAVALEDKGGASETILVSKDVCLRIKAEMCGITSQDLSLIHI